MFGRTAYFVHKAMRLVFALNGNVPRRSEPTRNPSTPTIVSAHATVHGSGDVEVSGSRSRATVPVSGRGMPISLSMRFGLLAP